MAESSGIDFVITWVDGADPAWRRERNSYASDGGFGCSEARFRDWGLLRYWFRGVERFAPWVDKIHFVTWGHVPAWLNCDHPKIRIVNHRDFIPREYLPTFNSNAIELNMHRIPELAEQFVPDECRCAHLTASNAARWAQSIRAREYTVVCANDNALLDEFETTRGVIAAAFAAVFPDRCSFEREDAP